jgi:Protein of unknown function (DUF3562)
MAQALPIGVFSSYVPGIRDRRKTERQCGEPPASAAPVKYAVSTEDAEAVLWCHKSMVLRTDSDRIQLEKIAADAQCPVEMVELVYLSELSALDQEARIQAFVPVIALRRARHALRHGVRGSHAKQA